jgi:magnesium-transporting ATPase (P-type)
MVKKKRNNDDLEKHVSGQANKPLSKPAHALNFSTLILEIKANPEDGLASSEARLRLDDYGRNEIGDQGGVSVTKILVSQVANAMILVLIIAMAVSFGIRSWVSMSRSNFILNCR